MRVRSRLGAHAFLESAAIADIVLNMFIFFFTAFSLLYTFSTAPEAQIDVVLPQGSSAPVEARRQPLLVSVDAAGRLFLGEDALPRAELAAALAAALAREPVRPVLVRSDRSVPLETVVGLLELARDAGAARTGIAVRQRAPAPPPR